VKEKVAYGFENALNYSRDDFDEDGHATTIRLIAWHAPVIPVKGSHPGARGHLTRSRAAVLIGEPYGPETLKR
jgi:hypothetical protein